MRKTLDILLEFFELTIIGALIFVIVYLFVGQLLEVSGDSMEPNFHDKEQIVAEKLSPNITELKRGDIVIFNDPTQKDKLVIKRIVGLPGEEVKIENGLVYINNTLLEEPYLAMDTYTNLKYNHKIKEGEEYEIGEDSYIVLGDNRDNSRDSREWGALHKNNILGKAMIVYYPVKNFKIVINNYQFSL